MSRDLKAKEDGRMGFEGDGGCGDEDVGMDGRRGWMDGWIRLAGHMGAKTGGVFELAIIGGGWDMPMAYLRPRRGKMGWDM